MVDNKRNQWWYFEVAFKASMTYFIPRTESVPLHMGRSDL